MAREHARIFCSIWNPDDDFVERTPEAQRLFFLIISQREMNNGGVIPLMISKWARRSKHTTAADIRKAFDELVEHRYLVVDESTEEVLVRSHLRRDEVMKHRYMRRSALRAVEQIESPQLRREVARELHRIGDSDGIVTASLLDPDGISSTQLDAIGSGSRRTQPDDVATGSRTTQPDGIELGSQTTHGGRGGGRGSGSVPSLDGSGGGTRERATTPPPEPNRDRDNPRCGEHRDIPATERGPNCRACAAVRREADHIAAELGPDVAIAAARGAWRATVDACPDCDENGRLETADGTPGPRHHPHPEDPA